jgi:polar amino acid transport system permease protein
MMRSSRVTALRLAATCFVEFFRNIPALVQVFWCYYALPVLTGLQGSAFVASAVALTLYSTAYLAEIYRSGIESIEPGQWEAARAIGLGYLQQMRYIILPQSIRRMIPAFTNQIIEIIKPTTVASTIAYAEVLYYAKLLSNQQYRPLESYTTAAVLLIGILLVLSYASAALERRLRRAE